MTYFNYVTSEDRERLRTSRRITLLNTMFAFLTAFAAGWCIMYAIEYSSAYWSIGVLNSISCLWNLYAAYTLNRTRNKLISWYKTL